MIAAILICGTTMVSCFSDTKKNAAVSATDDASQFALLCTRWIDLGQENREWWEITIAANRMNWTALRQNPDGTTFVQGTKWKKVN